MSPRGKAVWAAYADTGAAKIDCPNCGAAPGIWCTRPDGRVRRTPCVDRITVTGQVAVDRADTHRDFSEPLHQTE